MIEQILIVDTETTALETDKGQVIEVGAILYSVKHQTVIQQVSTLFPAPHNPAEHINRIKPEPLQEMKAEVAKLGILMMLKMAQMAEFVVAHNADFDSKWFGQSGNGKIVLPALVDASGQPHRWLCTCSDFEWPRQTRQGQSLVELLALAHGIGVCSVHRALTDCLLIAALLTNMEDLQDMFAKALRPKAIFKALVSYEERELAKQAGFKWYPERKAWERKMTVEDARELAFPVKQTRGTMSNSAENYDKDAIPLQQIHRHQ